LNSLRVMSWCTYYAVSAERVEHLICVRVHVSSAVCTVCVFVCHVKQCHVSSAVCTVCVFVCHVKQCWLVLCSVADPEQPWE